MNENTPVYPKDTELDRHSPLHLVLRTMLAWCQELSGNEFIYDDERGFSVSTEEVEVMIRHLGYVPDLCAIDVSDHAPKFEELVNPTPNPLIGD